MVVGDVDFRLWAEDGVDGMAEEMREGGSGGRSLTCFDDMQARTDCSV